MASPAGRAAESGKAHRPGVPPNERPMPEPVTPTQRAFEFTVISDTDAALRLFGNIDAHNAPYILNALSREMHRHRPARLDVDLSGIGHFDDFGAVLLIEIKQQLEASGGSLHIDGTPETVARILRMVDFHEHGPCGPIPRQRSENPVIRLGAATLNHLAALRSMVDFVGSVAIAFFRLFRHPKNLRLSDTIQLMEKTGVNALPIVGLISFLLGLVIAFMSSLQLRQFGANTYVASLVALAMVSELGPIMTAIVVAGRSGSAFAAEIGTMKISEEIDALVVMGFDPALFLAVPRIIASVIVIPLLTLFADLFAVAGGMFIGVFVLNLTATSYIDRTLDVLKLFEIMWGLSKSVVFALIISWVGCLRGFQTKGGADAVGNAATSAVVTSIFLIILFDSMFAILRSYW